MDGNDSMDDGSYFDLLQSRFALLARCGAAAAARTVADVGPGVQIVVEDFVHVPWMRKN